MLAAHSLNQSCFFHLANVPAPPPIPPPMRQEEPAFQPESRQKKPNPSPQTKTAPLIGLNTLREKQARLRPVVQAQTFEKKPFENKTEADDNIDSSEGFSVKAMLNKFETGNIKPTPGVPKPPANNNKPFTPNKNVAPVNHAEKSKPPPDLPKKTEAKPKDVPRKDVFPPTFLPGLNGRQEVEDKPPPLPPNHPPGDGSFSDTSDSGSGEIQRTPRRL